MLDRANIANNNWKLDINWNIIPTPEAIDASVDIRMLAIIAHLVKDLPIMFNNDNLMHFRANLTLALYNGTSIL